MAVFSLLTSWRWCHCRDCFVAYYGGRCYPSRKKVSQNSLSWQCCLITCINELTTLIFSYRSNTFFYLLTCQLLDECVIPPLTAFLMAKSTYVPLIAGVVTLAFSTVLSLALPETLPVSDFSGKTPELSDNTASELQDKYEMSKGWLSGFESSFAFATRNTTVMALILSYVIYEVGQQATDLLLLYVSKRYGWTLSKVSFPSASQASK